MMRASPAASFLEVTGYTITTLPSDVLFNIFVKMEKFEDLAVCGSVCRRWNSVLEQALAALRRSSSILKRVPLGDVRLCLPNNSTPDAHTALSDLSTIYTFLPFSLVSLTLHSCVIFTTAATSSSDAYACFQRLVKLRLDHCHDMAAASVRAAVAHCGSLRDLQLIRCTGTGPQFWKELRSCAELQRLEVEGCEVGQDGLSVIGGMTNLTHLKLYGCTNVPGMSLLACLSNLPNLKSLELTGLRVAGLTAHIVAVVADMCALRWLVLDRMCLSDGNVVQLAPLSGRLERLSLQGNEDLTDASLEMISRMKLLENLKLNHCTGITVNGVKRLLDVPSLSQLFLLGCQNLRCAEFNKLQFPASSFVCI